jgi:hypothetical protein
MKIISFIETPRESFALMIYQYTACKSRGSKLPDVKTLNAFENCHVNDKKCVCIFQQVYKNCTFLPLSCSEMCVFCF